MRKLKLFLRKNSVSNWYSFCWLATSFYVIVLAIFIILPGKARLLARTELPIAFIIFNTFSKYCFFQLCIPELYKCDYSDMIYFTKRGLKIDWILHDWLKANLATFYEDFLTVQSCVFWGNLNEYRKYKMIVIS